MHGNSEEGEPDDRGCRHDSDCVPSLVADQADLDPGRRK